MLDKKMKLMLANARASSEISNFHMDNDMIVLAKRYLKKEVTVQEVIAIIKNISERE